MNSRIGRDEIRKLYEQHSRGLFAYACTFVSSFATAEDILHQVFARLLRLDLEITGAPVSYLYRAIRNTALNQIRDRSREVHVEDAEFAGGWLESPAGLEQTGIELQAALQALPAEQREIILLHIWGEMTFDEAANVLGISANTAASRYRYGLSKLREQFQIGARRKYGSAR